LKSASKEQNKNDLFKVENAGADDENQQILSK
jgi:hypothetical protein